MPCRVLGRTGVQVSALGLGGFHIGNSKLSSAEAVRITKVVTPIECLHYAMNLPTSVVITGIDSTSVFDSTAKHPEWLGEESSRTRRRAGV